MIRRAAPSDLDALTAMGERFHRHADIAEIPFCPASFRATLESGFDNEDQAYFVADEGGQVRAMAGALVYPCYFNHGARMGQELFWWSECRAGLALHAALAEWATERGALSFSMIALAGKNSQRMQRLYERRGYRATEQSFIKGL